MELINFSGSKQSFGQRDGAYCKQRGMKWSAGGAKRVVSQSAPRKPCRCIWYSFCTCNKVYSNCVFKLCVHTLPTLYDFSHGALFLPSPFFLIPLDVFLLNRTHLKVSFPPPPQSIFWNAESPHLPPLCCPQHWKLSFQEHSACLMLDWMFMLFCVLYRIRTLICERGHLCPPGR